MIITAKIAELGQGDEALPKEKQRQLMEQLKNDLRREFGLNIIEFALNPEVTGECLISVRDQADQEQIQEFINKNKFRVVPRTR